MENSEEEMEESIEEKHRRSGLVSCIIKYSLIHHPAYR
jgi:hypothetical protein